MHMTWNPICPTVDNTWWLPGFWGKETQTCCFNIIEGGHVIDDYFIEMNVYYLLYLMFTENTTTQHESALHDDVPCPRLSKIDMVLSWSQTPDRQPWPWESRILPTGLGHVCKTTLISEMMTIAIHTNQINMGNINLKTHEPGFPNKGWHD